MSAGTGPILAQPRRAFFRTALLAAGTLLAWGWGTLGLDRQRRQRPSRISVPEPQGDGVTIQGDFVLVREGGALAVFDARCPHLGCRISRVDEGVLVCPCHGSRFNLAGRRLAGPAATGLRRLRLLPSTEPQRVVVDLSS